MPCKLLDVCDFLRKYVCQQESDETQMLPLIGMGKVVATHLSTAL